MDKIKVLLEKSGCSPDLIVGICDAMVEYKRTVKEGLDKEYKVKLEQAKKVCVEETESYKRELGKRVAIMCEAKSAAIESTLKRHIGQVETEATSKLRQVQTVLEGVKPNAVVDGKTKADLEKAIRQIQQLTEAKNLAVSKANRQTMIAEKTLSNNKRLTAEVERLKRVLSESAPAKQPVKVKPTGRTVTSRPTLVEHQERKPMKPSMPQSYRSDVQSIAATIADIG